MKCDLAVSFMRITRLENCFSYFCSVYQESQDYSHAVSVVKVFNNGIITQLDI